MNNRTSAILTTALMAWCIIASCSQKKAPPSFYVTFPEKPSGAATLLIDKAGLLSDSSENRINRFLNIFFHETDIEFRAVCMPDIDSNIIDLWTNGLFEQWEVGKLTRGKKGLLFVLASKERLVRMEVGYDLEGIYTDGLVGYIQNEQLRPFFEHGSVAQGFEAALEFIVAEAHSAIQSGTYQPGKKISSMDNWTGGGGAEKKVAIGSRSGFEKQPVAPSEASHYAAQPTPQETFKRYLEASTRHINDPDLGIYTPQSRKFFRNRVVTNAQQDAVRQFVGIPHSLEINGNYAVIYFPDRDRTFNPFFLCKRSDGWQLDFVTMSNTIRFNHQNKWFFASQNHPYMFAFDTCYIGKNGFVTFNHSTAERGYLNIVIKPHDDAIEIMKVSKGCEAEKKGMQSGDYIMQVNDKTILKDGWKAVVKEMKQKPGTMLHLSLHRPRTGSSIPMTLTLQKKR